MGLENRFRARPIIVSTRTTVNRKLGRRLTSIRVFGPSSAVTVPCLLGYLRRETEQIRLEGNDRFLVRLLCPPVSLTEPRGPFRGIYWQIHTGTRLA